MKFKKPNHELALHLEEALTGFDCERRKMFGQPAYFVNSNMFAGIFGDEMFIRLSESDREKNFSEYDESALFEPLKGRPMREYVVVPESLYMEDEEFSAWIEAAWSYANSIPPKKKKRRN